MTVTAIALRGLSTMAFALALSGCALWKEPEKVPSQQEIMAGEAEEHMRSLQAEPLPYKTDIAVEGVEKDAASEIRSAFQAVSQLFSMKDELPDGRLGLERRAAGDRDSAVRLLQSLGYYNGQAQTKIDWDADPALVQIIFTPGPRYHVGKAVIETHAGDGSVLSEHARDILKNSPKNLKEFGLADGDPAAASAVTGAVGKVPDWYKERGFPFASSSAPRYRLYPSRQELDPLVHINTGPFARFGELHVEGTENVSPEYLKRIVPWKDDDIWRASRLDTYRDMLLQSGLFREVTVQPDMRTIFPNLPAENQPPTNNDAAQTKKPEGSPVNEAPGKDSASEAKRPAPLPARLQNDTLPVLLKVREGTAHRMGAGVSYNSDVGPGVKGFWEHRNLLGEAERLRLTGEIAQDRQELTSSFSKPAFLQKNQNLVSDMYVRNETTDAYDLTGAYADIGLERKLSRRWWGSVRASGQGGRLREDGSDWTPYGIFGMPVTLRREGTDNLLNPTQGTRLLLSAAPYTGQYHKPFSLVRMQADFSAYYAPLTDDEGKKSDKLVLAARGVVGGMAGSMGRDVERIPGSLRFYAGGGGTVRGYKYQTVGPRNSKGDPQGGLSFTALNMEARWRVTDTIGIVPFVDAGAVYDTVTPDFSQDLSWAAGLGFRFYSPVGPVRLDVAFPLNDHDNQKTFQLYISIGQAF